jgi:hypothetical protein
MRRRERLTEHLEVVFERFCVMWPPEVADVSPRAGW